MKRTVPLHYCLACGAYWSGTHSCPASKPTVASEAALAAATEALVEAALALDAHRRALATCAETEKYPMSDLAKALRGHAATAAAYRKAKGEGA